MEPAAPKIDIVKIEPTAWYYEIGTTIKSLTFNKPAEPGISKIEPLYTSEQVMKLLESLTNAQSIRTPEQ